MPIRIFLQLTAATTAVIGAAFVCIPNTVVNVFLPEPFGTGAIFVRFLGSALIGYAFLNAYASRYDHLVLVRANLVGNFATLFIAFVISIVGVLLGALNVYGIAIVLLHAVFGAGFGWYLLQLRNHAAKRSKLLQ